MFYFEVIANFSVSNIFALSKKEIGMYPTPMKHLTLNGSFLFGSYTRMMGLFFGCCMYRLGVRCFIGLDKYLDKNDLPLPIGRNAIVSSVLKSDTIWLVVFRIFLGGYKF